MAECARKKTVEFINKEKVTGICIEVPTIMYMKFKKKAASEGFSVKRAVCNLMELYVKGDQFFISTDD